MSQLPYRPYIRPLIREQQHRGVRSVLSLLGIVNKPLRTTLARRLGGAPGTPGSLLSDPVFEPTFGWTESEVTLGSLSGTSLNKRLVNSLCSPPDQLKEEYTFPLSRRPFTHQLRSWDILSKSEPKSLVVTSGTGSGKTECFMIPILNRLANQSDTEGSLTGVRALFIYPLNALIASQQNRLDAWTDGFEGDLRYCLYTGQLEDQEKSKSKEYQGQVIDRQSLRKSPPPMLITNATMLEYMLVRKEDEPILKQSQGKLEWIVLDEAHTYVGSQAAEMALLLRRTMIAFGVKPENVRFIATSATFSQDNDTAAKLQRFLADMAGVDTSQVEVVYGKRKVPPLPDVSTPNSIDIQELSQIDSENETSDARYIKLANNNVAREIRASFLGANNHCAPQSLSRLRSHVKQKALDTDTAIQWLDLLSGTRAQDGTPFLPLRIHLFHNVLSSVGACVNVNCSARGADLLESPDWQFGAIYSDSSTNCKCGSPVLTLIQCTDCAEPFLKGYVSTRTYELRAAVDQEEDEFALNVDVSDEIDVEAESQFNLNNEVLLCNTKHSDLVQSAYFDLGSKKLSDKALSELAVTINLFTPMDDISCPCCGEKKHARQFRRIAVGAPFTLSTVIASLLEFCPKDKDNASALPSNGRKMISFTDSRQGTARTAVKIQQDSERGKVRSFIYHRLISAQARNELSAEESEDLAFYQQKEKNKEELRPTERRILQGLLEKLSNEKTKTISWSEMVQELSIDNSLQHFMLDYYAKISPQNFKDGLGASTLAKLFLLREFARRPKHQNSLESMGIVRLVYPQLSKITRTPADWPNPDINTWRSYLKILLDFYIRENSFVSVPPQFLNLMGARIRPKHLLPPTSQETDTSRVKRWPQAKEGQHRYARPIALILNAFNWVPDTEKIRVINRILTDAWNDMNNHNLLKKSDDGYSLSFDEVHFQLIEKAGLCPFTRRFLDTNFMNMTPYLGVSKRQATVTEFFDIPIYDHAFNLSEEDLQRARDWLETDKDVVSLREKGLWSDLHDRIIEGVQFFRTAEHSAQQSQKRLKQYEDGFKAGKINLLSCSTTMEMGVDIGGITIVAMNNVPPHPANYLQRAGRAGRRNETRSVAMTVCKQTPHDQSVFKDPIWPFKTKITVPEVSLRSEDLLRRHINSYLLSRWLKLIVKDAEAMKLKCGAFFIEVEHVSVCDRFALWCNTMSKDFSKDSHTEQALLSLIKNTPFSRDDLPRIVNQTKEQIESIQKDWRETLAIMIEQQEKVFAGTKESNPAFKALALQRKRLEDEYLLRELAESHFLPGYGFPTGLVSFDNQNITNFKDTNSGGRDDNRAKFRQLPSRDRATGIREYAPGAELVIDGLVYKSSGITLNWHAPASETDLKEAQLFKFAWHCKECGAAGSAMGVRPESCDSCGKELLRDRVKEYLVPSGFAVEFYGDPPHNDVSAPTFVPVQQPWLSLSSNWMPLANAANGSFRTSNSAHLFHHTSGASGNGFAICLECGRAEQMLGIADSNATLNEQFLPTIFRKNKTHTRLRGGRNEKGETTCPGSENSWKIKQSVNLGHDSKTDAIELILSDPKTGLSLHDEVVAYSLAVAIRAALAAKIGIQVEELGCASREQRVAGTSQVVSVIQIFDNRSGGYCTQANEILLSRDFWETIRSELSCREECGAACQHCLLSYDTRFSFDKLNRHAALGFLTDDWISSYRIPANQCCFGDSTRYETFDVADAIRIEISKASTKLVRLFLHEHVTDWDFPSAEKLNSLLIACAHRNIKTELIAPVGVLAKLADSERFKLASLTSMGVAYGELDLVEMTLKNFDLFLCAQVESNSEVMTWAGSNQQNLLPNTSWCNRDAKTLYVKGDHLRLLAKQTFSHLDIIPSTGDAEVEVFDQINGPIVGFGKRFWALLTSKSNKLSEVLNNQNDPLHFVEYSDRYLRNPLMIALLVETINELKQFPSGDQTSIEVKISTISSNKIDTRPSANCWDDWADEKVRDQVLEKAISYCGLDPKLEVNQSGPSSKVMHSRRFKLHFRSGKTVTVRLDQGFAYWRFSGINKLKFPFKENISTQVEQVAHLYGNVICPDIVPTQIFIKMYDTSN